MKNKIIEAILEAEKETENIFSKAKVESSKIISQAEEDNTKTKNSALETSKKLLKQQTEDSEKICKQQFDNALQEYSDKAKEIEQNAKKNFTKAINVLLNKMEKLN